MKAQETETKPAPKFTKQQLMMLGTLSFGNFCSGACAALQAPFFPKEATTKGATSTEYGLIFGIYQLTVLIFAPILGKLIGHVPAKMMMNFGMFVLGLTTISFGLMDFAEKTTIFVAFAFIIRIAEGIGATALRISSLSIVGVSFPDKESMAYSILATFVGVGFIVGPTVGGALFDLGGYGLPFYVSGSLVLVDAIIIFFTLPNIETSKKDESKSKGDWKKLWLSPGTILCALLIFTGNNFTGFNSATLEPNIREFGLSGTYLGLLFALCGILYAAASPVCGWLCDKKFDEKYLCLFGCMLMIMAIILIGPMSFLGIEKNINVIIAANVLWGISFSFKSIPTFSEILKVAVSNGLPADISTYGQISSIIVQSQTLGGFVGPAIGGYCLDTIGYQNGLLLVLTVEVVITSLLVAYTIVWIRRSHAKVPEEKVIEILSIKQLPYI